MSDRPWSHRRWAQRISPGAAWSQGSRQRAARQAAGRAPSAAGKRSSVRI